MGFLGTKTADEYPKAAAEGDESSDVTDEYRWKTSLQHMTRVATEARPRATTQWIGDHVGPKKKYKPPKGKGLGRKLLCQMPKSVSGRFYQLLSGHAAIGLYLRDKIHMAVDSTHINS